MPYVGWSKRQFIYFVDIARRINLRREHGVYTAVSNAVSRALADSKKSDGRKALAAIDRAYKDA